MCVCVCVCVCVYAFSPVVVVVYQSFDAPILAGFLDAAPTAELEPITSDYVQGPHIITFRKRPYTVSSSYVIPMSASSVCT